MRNTMETKEKPTTTKDKRRNNEKRKEKSRDAARSRRSKETEVFTDLANALPIPHEQVSQLDKASVMRLAIAFLKARDMVSLVPQLNNIKEDKSILTDQSMFLKSLEGFLIVMSPDGDVVYMSENVSDYLGITQIDLMGQNIYEYSHPCDHDEIKEILSDKNKDDNQSSKSFFIRFKCTLTSKGRSVNLKSATYKVIHCNGHMLEISKDLDNKDDEKNYLNRCFIAIGQPIPHPSNIEAPLPKQTFLTKHSLDMKFTHADDKIMMDVLGYDSEDLVGKSLYDYHHAMDSDSVCSSFKSLFSKGQCETNRYRFLAKTGGYVWVLTQATLIYDTKISKPQSVVCVNYLISGVECKDEVYSISQLASIKTEKLCNNNNNSTTINKNTSTETTPVVVTTAATPPPPPRATPEKEIIIVEKVVEQDDEPNIIDNNDNNTKLLSPYIEINSPPSTPITTTSTIWAPRTEDMNKGFITFSDDDTGITFKDEPEDLTHLAPVAGDVCVPLDDHPFLTDIMLDDFLLRDNFGPLLTDEPTDPFISYRDTYDTSPQLLSPNMSKNSECSLPSLNSPSDSLSDEDRMSTFMNLHMDDEPELITKAPFIPMNVDEDLLISDDLICNNNEKSKTFTDSSNNNNSSLAQLLSTTNYKKNNSNSNSNIVSNNNENNTRQQVKSTTNDHGGGIIQNGQIINEYYKKNSSQTPDWNDFKVITPPLSPVTHHQQQQQQRNNSNKRTSQSTYESTTKRSRNEPKEKMSPELLQQLMKNNSNRGRPKSNKSNWLLDSGGQKAACISQPSDSVLMNLLDDPMIGTGTKKDTIKTSTNGSILLIDNTTADIRRDTIRKNSISLLEPEATAIPSLLDLTQQDYEVNAPVNNSLLQGADLLTALETTGPII